MRIRSRLLVAAVLAVFFLGACATLPVSRRDRSIHRLIDTVNEGTLDEVVEISVVPFVLDREIIALESDLITLWERLRDAGFTLPDARITEVEPVSEESYRTFASSMELRVYFRKYLASDGTIVTVESDNGTFLLLVGGRQWFTPELYGIKGPV